MKLFSSKLILFSLIFGSLLTPVYSEKWDKNITSKIDVQTFWKQVKETREIKYADKCHKTLNFMSIYLLEED